MNTDLLSSAQLKPFKPSFNELNHKRKNPEPAYINSFWHSLFLFNISRIIITGGLIILAWLFQVTNLGSHNQALFFFAAWLYLLLSIVFMLLIKWRNPDFSRQLILQVCADVIFICIMTYASGGLEGGLGVVLMISLAGAGLISKGKIALFFAAIATIGILLQEIYAFLYIGSYTAQFTHAALLSMGYFTVAWLAHRLAAHAIASEKLAQERGVDLMNMAQINQLIIQDLQEGILVIDRNGNIRQCNMFAKKMIGLKSQPDFFEPLSLADYVPALALRLSIWRKNLDISFDLLSLAQSNMLVRTRFVPIEDNPHASVVIYLEDTSQIQFQIQQLKLAALGRLTANIAHEIRNPLSSISHAAEFLAEDDGIKQTKSIRRLLRIIKDNSHRLNKIVQDVLQLNRRDAAQAELIDSGRFVHAFISDFCLTERIDQTVFQLELIDNCLIKFDPDHLRQILWNLCRNAWRHCRQQQGSVEIKLARCSNTRSILLDIADDGPGVTEQHAKQLFEPFFTTAANGTGLGLYIAREFCEANHASLTFIKNTGGHFRIKCKDVSQYV